MVKKLLLLQLSLFFAGFLHAQIEVVKMVGKGSDEYGIGFGALLKAGIPVSEGGSVTIEVGVVFNPIKESGWEQGIAFVPIKAGYRYILNGTSAGFFVEPQVGYCVYGVLTNDDVDEKISGFDWAVGTGYLFPSNRRSQYELGLRYETIYFKGGPGSFLALRFVSSFSFGRRE